MATNPTIGFIGAGKMATALGKGFIQAGLAEGTELLASDSQEAARTNFERETGGQSTRFNLDVVRRTDTILLAVKPAQVNDVLDEICEQFTDKKRLISIAAGVPLSRLQSRLPEGSRVVRVMPNTPALVGVSATAFAPGESATDEDVQLVQKLFSAVGVAFAMNESLLDAVTGLSGSGPAYVYLMIEALSDGGVAAGLPRDVATRLAAQTVLGGAKMVLETGYHPGELKDMVTSPGGTTIEGVHQLEKGNVRAAFMNAVRAAADKARQLGKG